MVLPKLKGHLARTTFLSPPGAQPVEQLNAKTFRERCLALCHGINKSDVPEMQHPFVFVPFYILKSLLYVGLYWWVICDHALPIWDHKNVKSFIVYTLLGDAVGFNSTCGPLGGRSAKGAFFMPMWNFTTVGTITAPMIRGLPCRRSFLLVAAYCVYLGLLLRAMLSATEIGPWEAGPPVVLLAMMAPFDFVIAEASRAEHYGYMLVCLCFNGPQWIFGCQCVQLALWTGAGISKLGPWFKYVVPFMTGNAPWARLVPGLVTRMYKDFPTDMNPSWIATALAHIGTAVEMTMGALCCFGPTRGYGVLLTLCFHTFIAAHLPMASVQEWNVFCCWSSVCFFWEHQFSIPTDVHPLLAIFLVVVLLLVPIYGQLVPTGVPFLFAYRPYAGNWFFGWHVVSKAGQNKLNRLKTASVLMNEKVDSSLPAEVNEFVRQTIQWGVAADLMYFPHFRPLLPILEKLEQMFGWQSADEYRVFVHMQWLQMVHGWNLGTAYHVQAGAPGSQPSHRCRFGCWL